MSTSGQAELHSLLTIVHISDLHIGSEDSKALDNLILSLKKINRPIDFVIATGDIVNTPGFYLRKARRELNRLRTEVPGIQRLMVIPGNHDYLHLGLGAVPWLCSLLVWIGLFVCGAIWVAGQGVVSSIPPSIPIIIKWVAGPILVLFLFFLLSAAFARAGFWFFLGEFFPQHVTGGLAGLSKYFLFFPVISLEKELGISLIALNSNPWFAAAARGRVGWLQNRLLRRRMDWAHRTFGPHYVESYKIAILHHHLLPIPYEKFAESYMVLEDSAQVLRVLAEAKIDLVLHGHKHEQVDSAINLGTRASGPRNISVVACGTTSSDSDTRQHTYNLLTLQPRDGYCFLQRFAANPGEEFVEV